MIMIDRLESIVNKYNELTSELSKPEIISDIKKMTEISKEQRRLEGIVNVYNDYKKVLSDLDECKEWLNLLMKNRLT